MVRVRVRLRVRLWLGIGMRTLILTLTLTLFSTLYRSIKTHASSSVQECSSVEEVPTLTQPCFDYFCFSIL
jgi:hypothetical protein